MRAGVAMAGALIATSNLAAQRPAETRPRDSIVVRVLAPGMVSDSLQVLVREFNREQAGTQRWRVLMGRIDSLVGVPGFGDNTNIFVRKVMAGAEAGRVIEAARAAAEARRGSLGFSTQGPSLRDFENGDMLVTQLSHPTIVSVDPQSPAGKAGIAAGDVLIAYNGIDVVNHTFSMNALLKPDTKVAVTVRRDGETKDYQLTVAKAPARVARLRSDVEYPIGQGVVAVGPLGQPGVPNFLPEIASAGVAAAKVPLIMLSSNGVLGASVSTVSADLAKALKLHAGVLVTDAPEETPAFRAGLRAGDVITAVDEQPVVTLSQLREMLMRARAHAVALQVARNQKTRTVTLSAAPLP